MIATCITDELSAIARGSCGIGTSDGSNACWAGIWSARDTPMTIEIARISSRSIQSPPLPHASRADTPACIARLAASTSRRSTRSTSCPAGIVRKSAGTNCINPTRPRSHALPVRSYICQPSATSMICWPAVPTNRATSRLRRSPPSRRPGSVGERVTIAGAYGDTSAGIDEGYRTARQFAAPARLTSLPAPRRALPMPPPCRGLSSFSARASRDAGCARLRDSPVL